MTSSYPSLDSENSSRRTTLADPDVEQYRCAGMIRFPFSQSEGVQLLYLPHHRITQPVSLMDLKIARSCTRFADLDTHAEEICKAFNFPPAKRPEVLQLLTGFANSGVLLSRSSLLVSEPEAVSDRAAQITTIAVPTENRPAQVARCLPGYAENARRYGRDVEFTVADGSQRPEMIDLAKAMLGAISREYSTPVFYAGYREKLAYCEALATSYPDLPVDVIRFALFGDDRCSRRTGGNRNAILLDRVGDMIFSVDDDTVCLPARLSAATNSDVLDFQGENDPTEFWFFHSRAHALASVALTELDVLALHEKLLGRSTRSLARQYLGAGGTSFDHLCKHLLHGLQHGRGRVLVTYNGLLGDSGMQYASGLLHQPTGGTRDRFLQSEADYRSALSCREIYRAAPCTTVSDSGACMSGFMGLDNQDLLPPFMPVLRSQDSVFGATVRRCFDNSFFGYLSVALLHIPPSERAYASDAIDSIACNRFCDLLTASMSSCQYPPRLWNSRDKLTYLGKYLLTLSELRQDEFEEFLRLQLWNRAGATIRSLEESLARFAGQPSFWASDVKRQIAVLTREAMRPEFVVARDLLEQHEPQAARAIAQDLVGKFGKLLIWWPDLVDAARQLRDAGRRIAVKLC